MVQLISFVLTLLGDILGASFDAIFSLLESVASKSPEKEYSADFAPISSVLGRFNFGYALVGGLRATTRDTAYKNALIIGPSGSGKSSTVLCGSIFTLARGSASLCIMDVSSEMYKLTSGWLKKMGYIIYRIDFSEFSDCFNCLAFCKTLSDIQKIAFLLIKNSGVESKSDPYWTASAEMVLSLFIEYLVVFSSPEFCNMANVVWLIDTYAATPEKIDVLFVRTKSDNLLTRYKAMNNISEKTLQSTLSTVRTALKIFTNPAVKRCTSTNTIDFSTFRKTKSVLFICTGINDVNFYAPLSAILFESLFKEIMSKIPEATEHSIFCLIDEMVTMRFQNLGTVYSNIRKYKGGCMGIVQDEKMLEMAFSPAESHSIKTNSSKVFLPGQPLSTCRDLEAILGKKILVDEKNGAEKTKFLKSSAEIRIMNEAIILVGNLPPMKAKPISFYNHWILKSRTQIPPYVRDTNALTTDPPLLPLP